MSQINVGYDRQTYAAAQTAAANAEAVKVRAVEVPGNKQQNVDELRVNEAVASINESLNAIKNEERQFCMDDDLGRLVVKIINSETKEIVRQLPTEEALHLSKKLQDIIGLMSG